MQQLHILIAGASGGVGEGMVVHLLKKGHHVTALVRQESKKEALEMAIEEENITNTRLNFIINSYHTPEEIKALTEQVSALGTLDIAIASLGGWYHGAALYNIPLQDWDTVLTNSLTSHLNFSKAILPLMERQEKGTFVMINGGAAEYAVPHSGVISVVAAAQKMMSQVLHSELKNKNIKVYGVGAFALVRTRVRANSANLWLGPEEIAQYILDLSAHEGEKAGQYWHKLAQLNDLVL
jgi:NAD(P)-dependent dehydrogenase (short-subunit alcohol dehydrogenase family)